MRLNGASALKFANTTSRCSYGGPGKIAFKFTTVQWAKQPKVAQAWRELARRHNLVSAELGDVDRVFGFLDAFLTLSYPIHYRYALPPCCVFLLYPAIMASSRL